MHRFQFPSNQFTDQCFKFSRRTNPDDCWFRDQQKLVTLQLAIFGQSVYDLHTVSLNCEFPWSRKNVSILKYMTDNGISYIFRMRLSMEEIPFGPILSSFFSDKICLHKTHSAKRSSEKFSIVCTTALFWSTAATVALQKFVTTM